MGPNKLAQADLLQYEKMRKEKYVKGLEIRNKRYELDATRAATDATRAKLQVARFDVATRDEKIIPTFKRIYHIRDARTYEEADEGRDVWS